MHNCIRHNRTKSSMVKHLAALSNTVGAPDRYEEIFAVQAKPFLEECHWLLLRSMPLGSSPSPSQIFTGFKCVNRSKVSCWSSGKIFQMPRSSLNPFASRGSL